MDKLHYSGLASLRRAWSREHVPAQAHVVPFGPYGGGQLTGHPIGLVIVLGFVAMALVGVPEARSFLAISLALGVVFGFLLWLYHQSNSLF